jgi:hypothetical protein
MWRTATEKFSFRDIRSIDSRFLVKAAVLASRKVKNAALEGGSQDVDVEDFISKCISFIRKGDEALLESNPACSSRPATQSQRPRRIQLDSDGEGDEGNDGDAHNWAWLDSRACFAVTKRPCLPGFLLGPLSAETHSCSDTASRSPGKTRPESECTPSRTGHGGLSAARQNWSDADVQYHQPHSQQAA